MTFKKGSSGNPNGRPKGALSRRVQLTKLLEPHAEKLIEKIIELALQGDVHALRICMERILPKRLREPIDIELPNELNQENLPQVKNNLLQAVLDGQIGIDDAEKFIKLLESQSKKANSFVPTKLTDDPLEASKEYQRIMMGNTKL